MAATYGIKVAEVWLQIQLEELSEFVSVREPLTTDQLEQLAGLIYETYPHLNLAEIMLFFQRFKRCRYGRLYGRLSPMAIMEALTVFMTERRRWIDGYKSRRELEQRRMAELNDTAMRRRYRERVPEAFTPQAPLTFLQYKLMGFDTLDSDELSCEINALKTGARTLPQDIDGILRALAVH